MTADNVMWFLIGANSFWICLYLIKKLVKAIKQFDIDL